MANEQVKVTVSGEDAGATALLTRVSRQVDGLIRSMGRQSDATTRAGTAQRKAAGDTNQFAAAQTAGSSAASSLAKRLVLLAASYAGISTVLAGIRRGLDINAELESSQLGIAALIASQGGLTDANGKVLSSVDALNASNGIAAEQLQKLRIAGLQTTSTFEQLSKAFQTAVGPGLAAGLSLDEIRKVTVNVTQAAASLNVPMQQLDQEVRSILDGSIDVNSRVAKTLQITSAQVKLERERGTLATFLNQKLAVFNASGEKAAQTFAGMASNAKEGVDLFLQTVSQPLFEKLRKAGNDALKDIFDLDTATLAPAFNGITAFARTAFDGLGDLLASAISGAIDGAKRLSTFISDNRSAIIAFAHDIAGAASELGRVVIEAVKLGVQLAGAAIKSGAVSAALNLVEGAAHAAATALKFVRDHIDAIAIVLAGAAFVAGVANLAAIDVALAGFAASIAAAPFTAAALAIGAVVVAVNALAVAQDRARETTRAANEQLTNATRYAPPLVEEFRKLAKQLDDGALKGDKLKDAQARVKQIKSDLIAISPQFRSALSDESDTMQGQADKAEALADKLKDVRALKVQEAESDLARLQAQAAEAAKNIPDNGLGEAGLAVAQAARARLEGLQGEIAKTRAVLKALGVEAATPIKLAPVVVTGTSDQPKLNPKKNTGAVTDTKNDLKQITDAAIAEQERQFKSAKDALDRELADNLVSWDDYFARLNAKGAESAEKQKALLKTLLAGTTDKGDRAQILGQLAQVERARTDAIAESAHRRADLEKALAKQTTDIGIQQLREEGQLAEARNQELTESFRELRARLVLENKGDAVRIIDSLIDVGTARAKIEEIEAALQRAAGERGQAESSVQTRVNAGVITERQARKELLAIYQRQKAAIQAQLPLLAAQAALTQSAVDVTALSQYAAELESLNVLIAQTGNSWGTAGKQITDAVQGDLAEFLGSTINNVKSLGEAFASLATSVVGSVQRIIASLLAQKLVEGIQKLLHIGTESSAAKLGAAAAQLTVAGVTVAGAAAAMLAAAIALRAASGGAVPSGVLPPGLVNAGIAAGVAAFGGGGIEHTFGFAKGGYTGPGSKYQPAGIVHKGEYVIPAHKVRELGIDRLDVLAGLQTPTVRRPRRGYADGGLVTGSQSIALGGSIALNVSHDGTQIQSADAFLETADGQRAVLKVVTRHKSRIAQIVRGA